MSKKARARYYPWWVGVANLFRVVVAKLFSNAGTGYVYTFRRPRTSPKFELMKYDPIGKVACGWV